MSSRLASALASLALIAVPAVAPAAITKKLARKVSESVQVLDEFLAARDAEIPQDLIDDATCIVVMPNVAKGAFVVGGRYGKGLASCRRENGRWGAPAFFAVGGASVGFQVGGQATDLVLVVRGEDGAKWLLKDKFTLGADASVAAGPVGRTAGAATDIALRAGILSYSRSSGAFVGAALDGAVMRQDSDDNARIYGEGKSGRDILMPEEGSPQLAIPASLAPFTDALERHAPSKK